MVILDVAECEMEYTCEFLYILLSNQSILGLKSLTSYAIESYVVIGGVYG